MVTTKHSVTLGAFAAAALAGKTGSGSRPEPEDVVRAIVFYLNDRDANAAGWNYPEFLGEKRSDYELALVVEDALWRSLELEARRQSVTVGQLIEHATLYYAAELDAGHVTERMLGDSPEAEPA